MIGGAVGPLDGSDVDDPLPGPVRCHVDKAQKILTGIPEAHAPSGAGLIEACGAGHIEGDHTLVLVPGVDHPGELFIGAVQSVDAKQAFPVCFQLCKSGIHGGVLRELPQYPLGGILADDAGREEFLIPGVLTVAQYEDVAGLASGGESHIQCKACHGGAAVGDKVVGLAFPDDLGILVTAKLAKESVPVGIEAGNGGVDAVVGIVIPALPVLGLMVDDGVLHL